MPRASAVAAIIQTASRSLTLQLSRVATNFEVISSFCARLLFGLLGPSSSSNTILPTDFGPSLTIQREFRVHREKRKKTCFEKKTLKYY